MEKNNKPVLIGLIVILAVAFVYLLATRGSGGEVRENNEANNSSVAGQAKGEAAMDQPTVVTLNASTTAPSGMQPQIPAALTAGQLAELKAGAADHKPAELTFNVTGGSFYFAPNEIRVKQGDKVKIVFTNAGGTHNFILEAFNVKGQTIQGGESETIEFTADKKGTFEFYCGVGNGYHRQKGQIGVLLVE